MKNNIVSILLFICISIDIYGNNISLTKLYQFGLPVLDIETFNNEEPTAEYVAPPPGCVGNGIKNANKVSGKIAVYYNRQAIYDDRMTIKVRGNTSALEDKKSFKINLVVKADLLNKNKKYKDKEWVLIKDQDMKLYPIIGFKVCEMIGMQWTPRYQYVNVRMNGQYWGLYILAESVKRDPDCRIDVDKDTGYIIEYDPYWWNEELYFKSLLSQNFTLKYPEWDDITQDQLDYITNTMKTIETSIIYRQNYTDYIDVDPFVSWLLAHDILGTWDCGGSNMFLTKYDSNSKSTVMMANLWDFDTIFYTTNQWANIHNWNGFYFYYLFKNKNKTFQNRYVEKYNEIQSTFFNNIIDYLNDFANSREADYINMSRVLDSERWNYENIYTVADNVESATEWFTSRKIWLDKEIGNMDYSPTYIKNLITNDRECNSTYNLMGRKVSNNYKGIIIKNGKKYVQ
jgi:hypothetical protein